ncbi:hypothetical protein MKQ68_02985 [Chitinophaga horti]|uniref:WYL domain-containing protein n=1 Tax=Chitinophaga horti TaxID=2920382 RepID=A0ABY6J314_9BACT|nr:hypothetical protein [Chitinophaga horti]UYQ94055.1 hypothetical protein MKQ68_02985 [Chitinophaga horti]
MRYKKVFYPWDKIKSYQVVREHDRRYLQDFLLLRVHDRRDDLRVNLGDLRIQGFMEDIIAPYAAIHGIRCQYKPDR